MITILYKMPDDATIYTAHCAGHEYDELVARFASVNFKIVSEVHPKRSSDKWTRTGNLKEGDNGGVREYNNTYFDQDLFKNHNYSGT